MLTNADGTKNRPAFGRGGELIPPIRRLLGEAGPTPPWDDNAPIRSELFSVERLEDHARSLAAAQVVSAGERRGARLDKRLAENESVLVAAYRDTAAAIDAGSVITPAAEWLIDNFYVIERQIREIRADLPAGYYRQRVEAVLGVSLEGGQLHLDPSIPRSWPRFEIELRHGTSVYEILVENPNGVQQGVSAAWLDGEVIAAKPLVITLLDDGARHQVKARLG
jgi:hypothetical protein